MEEKRIERLGVCMKTFAEVNRQVLPIVGKCLDGMTKAAESIEPKTVSLPKEIHMHNRMSSCGGFMHLPQPVTVHAPPLRISKCTSFFFSFLLGAFATLNNLPEKSVSMSKRC